MSAEADGAEGAPAAYMAHVKTCLVVLHLSVFVSGLVGNALVCLSVYRNKSLQTVTNYYIVNLALADFLVILVCLPATVYWDLTLHWNFGLVLCKLVLYLQSISVSVSVLTLTCISVDRWHAICRPFEFSSSKQRAKLTIGLVWLASALLASPDLIFLTTRPLYEEADYTYMDCTYSWPEGHTRLYQLCIVTLLFISPFVLMTVSYAHIVAVLWRDQTMAESMQQTIHERPQQLPASRPRRRKSSARPRLPATPVPPTHNASLADCRHQQPDTIVELDERAPSYNASFNHNLSHNHNHINHQAADSRSPNQSPGLRPDNGRARPAAGPIRHRSATCGSPEVQSKLQMSPPALAAGSGPPSVAEAEEHDDHTTISRIESSAPAAAPAAAAVQRHASLAGPAPPRPARRALRRATLAESRATSGLLAHRPERAASSPHPVVLLLELGGRSSSTAAALGPQSTSGWLRRHWRRLLAPGRTRRPPAAAAARPGRLSSDLCCRLGAPQTTTTTTTSSGSPERGPPAAAQPPSRRPRRPSQPVAGLAPSQAPATPTQPAPRLHSGASQLHGSSHSRFCKLIESRKKAAKMLIVIVIMFGLCYLPVHFLNTLRYTVGLPQNDLTTIASLVSHWLCYFNSAVNPLIYNLMSGEF